MIKVLSVVGTRPEAIKMAPVIKELEKYSAEIRSVVCATAQHREMLDQVLELFDIQPDYDLDLMQPGQALSGLTARVLTALDEVMAQEQPDWLLVQGDTTTVMVGALVAYYHRVQVGHVEAGLRTGDKFQPFPEEINRRIADVLSDLYFAPTESNRQNLLREGVPDDSILVTGNTVIDALRSTVTRARHRVRQEWEPWLNGRRLLLVTAHRRENFGPPLEEICQALAHIAREYASDVHILYAVHPNPNVWEPVHAALGGIPNVILTPPLDYETFVGLMDRAYLVLTDSGGLQEEAPGLGKPVLVLREVTERPEAVAAGTVKVVGTSYRRIIEETTLLLDDGEAYERMAQAVNPYGDGRASQRIVAALLERPVEPFVRACATLNGMYAKAAETRI
ncbi:MAG TPA: UDP-N-acetylglucosamine 2-epimerase (non-hydrolyzing) [Anaerolineae bacterium]|nr:UDP-N-acetylglucosamine 2-epimerase (non-hydrolyzing) [Anaerolineae bacterium]